MLIDVYVSLEHKIDHIIILIGNEDNINRIPGNKELSREMNTTYIQLNSQLLASKAKGARYPARPIEQLCAVSPIQIHKIFSGEFNLIVNNIDTLLTLFVDQRINHLKNHHKKNIKHSPENC